MEKVNTKLGNIICNLHISRYWHSIAIHTSKVLLILLYMLGEICLKISGLGNKRVK